jgi:hypothetical protein
MTGTMPNMWEGVVSADVLTPLTILRTQAGNLTTQTKGVLRADVRLSNAKARDVEVRRLSFVISAPGRNGYERQVLLAEHTVGEPYPVQVESEFLTQKLYIAGPDSSPTPKTQRCESQDEFVTALQGIFKHRKLVTELHSLIAQINDANPDV